MSLAAVISEASRVADLRWRVALVSTQRQWHGGELQVALLAEGLRARGHCCRILARRGGVLAERLAGRGFEVATFSGPARLPHALWQIRRQLRRFRPHILHFNDSHALQAAGLASWGLPIHLRVAARRVDFPLRSAYSYRHLCDGVVCVSRAVRQICAEAGLPLEQLPVVHDGVDPLRLQQGERRRGRRVLGLSEQVPLLLTVAKLTDHKGHRYLLEALPAVLQRVPQTVLALAGDGPLLPILREQARRLKLGNHVRFLGFRADVPDLLAAADLLVVPSHMEGLCSSVIDAMFAGCPVVATRAGGIPDLLQATVDQDDAGWLVPPRDASALATAIQHGLQSPEMRRRFARQARVRARRHFSCVTMVDRTLEAFQRLLQLRQASQVAVRTTSATSVLVSGMSRSRSAY